MNRWTDDRQKGYGGAFEIAKESERRGGRARVVRVCGSPRRVSKSVAPEKASIVKRLSAFSRPVEVRRPSGQFENHPNTIQNGIEKNSVRPVEARTPSGHFGFERTSPTPLRLLSDSSLAPRRGLEYLVDVEVNTVSSASCSLYIYIHIYIYIYIERDIDREREIEIAERSARMAKWSSRWWLRTMATPNHNN